MTDPEGDSSTEDEMCNDSLYWLDAAQLKKRGFIEKMFACGL